MAWLQLTVQCPEVEVERVENALEAIGCVSITCMDAADQPILEPGPGETPLWQVVKLLALFKVDASRDLITNTLASVLDATLVKQAQIEVLEDQPWERAWMDDFKPMRFGERLWVCPHHAETPDEQAVVLRLDPGMAFGTGTHPTTALCLSWLDGADVGGKTVVDYGCGSGILGIAAALLGAQEVLATDIDPQALMATLDNAKSNAVADQIHTFEVDAMPQGQVPLVLANILQGPLIELAPTLTDLLAPEGHLVLSGLLAHQAEEVRMAYSRWLDLSLVAEQEEWVLLVGQKRRAAV